MNRSDNDLEDLLAQSIATIKIEMGENFKIENVNLAEMQRLAGVRCVRLK